MAQQRRTPRGGPGGGRRPGQRSGARTRAAAPVRPAGRVQPRFTGRAAILLLVLAVLTVSYASSMRAYLQQRSHIADLKSQIAEREASIDSLEREKRRWDDDAYVRTQARKRFGYLMPGETGFQVIDENGRPLGTKISLHDPEDIVPVEPTAWWTTAWESMELAGHPPKRSDLPAARIDAPKEEPQQ